MVMMNFWICCPRKATRPATVTFFYRTYESALPSTATGLRYLEEETERYRTTMENYQHACRIEEEGETSEEWEEER